MTINIGPKLSRSCNNRGPRLFLNRAARSIVLCSVAIVCAMATAYGQKDASIAAIQGDKYMSPFEGQIVHTTGVVTAVIKNGVFIQTPDDKVDANPLTSEGVYVFSGQNAQYSGVIGDMVDVTGTVQEFMPRSEKYGFTITEIVKPTIRTISKNNPLPAPIVLTANDLNPQKIDTMERYEGMRVKVDTLNVVAPTGGRTDDKTGITRSDGVFFGVLAGTPRPFREPGVDLFVALALKLPQTIPFFDTNPELLRVDSDAQTGAKTIDVTAGATVKNLTGVIDYSYRHYTLLVDAANPPVVSGNTTFVKVSAAGERETTVASFNIENFFDDERNSSNVEKETILPKEYFQVRLNKASLAVRNVLSMPDVLAVEEVENLVTLKKLADKINADAVAANQPNPKYEAYLEEGNDMRGIDSGFLVKSAKVKVIDTKQLAKDVKLDFKDSKGDASLFDRPPFLIRVEVQDAKTNQPFPLTVIVNHLKSYLGIDNAEGGDRVRQKRVQEAEWLASFIAQRQKEMPDERLIVCGDFNAFQFSDGFNDLIGTLRGKPDANVMTPAKATYQTGLTDLVFALDVKSRYSYVHDGSAQVLDHVLISQAAMKRIAKFGYARLDADFPAVYSSDGTRPERLSDHDAPVAFFNLDAPPPKPTAN